MSKLSRLGRTFADDAQVLGEGAAQVDDPGLLGEADDALLLHVALRWVQEPAAMFGPALGRTSVDVDFHVHGCEPFEHRFP